MGSSHCAEAAPDVPSRSRSRSRSFMMISSLVQSTSRPSTLSLPLSLSRARRSGRAAKAGSCKAQGRRNQNVSAAGTNSVDPRFLKVALKADESPVTIADKEAEQAMRDVIENYFPEHTIYGEEFGAHLPGRESGTDDAKLVWVLDPIDGTKSFITGKPLFGTLVSLVYDGEPILGIIDQPILGERWVGVKGETTKFNDKTIKVRQCDSLSSSYLYATSPDMFQGSTALSFEHLCTKVRTSQYGCDCYAYGLLSMGFCDIVCEADMKPFDYMALVPIIEGAGGQITDWNGKKFHHFDLADVEAREVLATGDADLHKKALKALNYEEQRHTDVAQVM